MANTFKVGDKVEHRTFGTGEIAFGPFTAMGGVERYLMKGADGTHYTLVPEAIKPAAKFEVGDVVKSVGGESYTIEAGPFVTGYGSEWYAVRDSTGVYHSIAGSLEAVTPEPADEPFKPGDVVRIPRDRLQMADVKAGDLLVVKRVTFGDIVVHAAPGARQEEWYFDQENVERVDSATVAVMDNVAYDLNARYKDRDGDYWTFKRTGDTVRGNCADTDVEVGVFDWCDTLSQAVRSYGPLTRV